MMMHDLPKASPLLLASVIGVMVTTPSLAAVPEAAPQQQREALTVSGSIAAGIEYNDNLTVTELETAAGTGDTAGTFEANADVNWQAGANTAVAAGYSFSGSRYQDIDAFDLDLHLLYADVSHDFAWLSLGANYYFADARLGGDTFLDLNQYSLYAGKLFADTWYLRGALNFTDKQFDVFDVRDADNEGFGVDLYRFFNAGRSSLMLGYAYEDEDTRGPAFDYTADTLRLRLNHRFTLAARDARVLLGYRWQDRDYVNATPAISIPRDDSQRVVEAQLEVDVMQNLALTAGWEYGDYDSRLSSADFTANRVAMAMRLSF